MSRPSRLHLPFLALALVVLTAAGCSAGSATPRSTATGVPSTGTPSTPFPSATSTGPASSTPAPAVCSGVAHCTTAARVDVDGDGRADQVGVAGERLADGGSVTVRVRTATGRLLKTTGHDVHWFAKPYFGAVAVDGEPGAEIVVGDTMGANYEQFRVVTYRDGRLVTLKAPPAQWTRAGLSRAASRWGVDGSYSFNDGVERTVVAGVATLTMTSASRNDSGTGHTSHRTSYRWADGAWSETSTRTTRHATDAEVAGVGGWHVPGLHRFVA